MKATEDTLPWPAVLAGASAALALSCGQHRVWLTLALALGLLLRQAVRVRLPERPALLWSVRLALFFGISGALFWDERGSAQAFATETVLGQLSLAELVIQAWRQRPSGGARGEAVTLLSALVFVAACNTRDHVPVTLVAPVYFGCVVFALRAMRDRTTPAGLGASSRLGLTFLVAVLASGGTLAEGAWAYREEIYRFFAKVDQWVLNSPSIGGFTDAPRLGGGPGRSESQVRVLRITGALPSPHWRGLAFSDYGGGAWHPTLAERGTQPLEPGLRGADALGPRCRVECLLPGLAVVFHPLASSGIADDPHAAWSLQSARGALLVETSAAWSCEVVAGGPPPWDSPVTPALLERCLAVPPEIDPRVGELARRIVGDRVSTHARIDAIVGYLATHHRYSLTTQVGAGDPVSEFLLEGKSAHCEYFASAAVLLLRSVGVPTRFVSGFFAHESAAPGVWIVRQQDAHAWAEAWSDPGGWVTVEATPADGQPAATAAAAPWWRRWGEAVADAWQAVQAWLVRGAWRAVGVVLVGGMVLLWLVRLARARLRRRRVDAPTIAYTDAGPELAPLAHRFTRLLEREGRVCPRGQTWQEFLGRPPGVAEDARAQARRGRLLAYAEAHAAARFGGVAIGPAAVELEQTLARLEASRSPG